MTHDTQHDSAQRQAKQRILKFTKNFCWETNGQLAELIKQAEEALPQLEENSVGYYYYWMLQTLKELKTSLETSNDRTAELEKLVYVHGCLKCAKCGFQLMKHWISEKGCAPNNEPDVCPNDGHPLWRVTERDAGNEMADRLTAQFEEIQQLKALATQQPGVSEAELCAEISDVLVDDDHSPVDIARHLLTHYTLTKRSNTKELT